ncbi:MAG: metal-dependent hydrolase [Hymenobacteraceae bacterium]|nr:metal-dependent hydrolase [Hymenobacteraceae bacterium]
MKVTYYGHSCFLREIGAYCVIFDPFISPNPLAARVKIEEIEADFILLSHGHTDHIHDVERIAARTKAPVLAPYETADYLRQRGVEHLIDGNVGGRFDFPFGTVRMVAALHSNRLSDGAYGGEAVGFVVETTACTVYYAGDTALTQEMKTFAELYPGGFDAAFLPVGGHYTMDVADALGAARWCGARRIVGMHFDTFPSLVLDHATVAAQARAAGVELLLPSVEQNFAL